MGCQSGCTFSEPSAAESNVQKKIIGYWESWNSEHACGTMPLGSIPVSMLTHLNVAFGYIEPSSYKIIAMDGVDASIYQSVGNLKAQNTNLKVSIALGGWTFTDEGSYRSVFTTMVASESLRATFINNLIGFLDEYGYDGVGKRIFSYHSPFQVAVVLSFQGVFFSFFLFVFFPLFHQTTSILLFSFLFSKEKKKTPFSSFFSC